MHYIEDLMSPATPKSQHPHGLWVPALAIRCSCIRCRLRVLRDAWAVIRGRAEAVTWDPKGESR